MLFVQCMIIGFHFHDDLFGIPKNGPIIIQIESIKCKAKLRLQNRCGAQLFGHFFHR